MIRSVEPSDASQLADIYNFYVKNSLITFEENSVLAEDMAQRITNINSANLPWLVAQDKDLILGYAYASKWKDRSTYGRSVEVTVYLTSTVTGQGWGNKLYQALFEQLQTRSIHAVMAGIALPNEASIALHEKFGMQKVAHFSEVGRKFDQWVDVGYWQLTLQN